MAIDMLSPSEPLPAELQLRSMIEIIARQIHHLDRMAGDFVDMSTIEGGNLELRVDHHDVRNIVREAVGVLAERNHARAIQGVGTPRPASRSAMRCASRQAVTNVVSNAIKYSPAGAPIDVRIHANLNDVTIEVADQGAGIARKDHNRIFEPFRRVGTEVMATGTGLGLFNVKRIVEAHDGRIEVESVPRRGSTFRICLPAAGGTATGDQSAHPQRS